MTSVCQGGGPSQPKPGTAGVVNLAGVALSDFLLAEGVAWVYDLAVGLGVISWDTASFCAGEPPALPLIDAARLAGYFNPINPLGAAQLRSDMIALLGHYFWYAGCECVSGTQPPPPLPMPQPPGYVTNPPGLGQPTTDTPCINWGDYVLQGSFDATGSSHQDAASHYLVSQYPSWGQIQIGMGPVNTPAFPVTVTIYWQSNVNQPILGSYTLEIDAYQDIATAPIISVPVPPGTHGNAVTVYSPTGANQPMIYDVATRFFCTAPPQSLDQPCCPPDPLITRMLTQVMLQLEQLAQLQVGPTPYKRGTLHAGLSSSGSITVSGCLGFLVHITSGVPRPTVLVGVPPYQWDLGWLSIMTGDGMIEERRLTRADQVWLPELGILATTFGYFLDPGVTADVYELVPASTPE